MMSKLDMRFNVVTASRPERMLST